VHTCYPHRRRSLVDAFLPNAAALSIYQDINMYAILYRWALTCNEIRDVTAGGRPPGPLGGQIVLGIFSNHLVTC
jgi:hypothetical protein